MYAQGSQECLRNAEHLFEDATTLLRNKSSGSAQSLIVTAIEEAGKAIILELADFDYAAKEVVKHSMGDHKPKKLVFLAMQRGLLFIGNIDRRYGSHEIDRKSMQKLQNRLERRLENLEKRRQRGFYVQVNVDNGAIENLPDNIKESEVQEFAQEAESYLKLCKMLCGIFREYRVVDKNKVRSNLRIFQENLANVTAAYDEA
jgi:AbiV family abortive infection protein